MSIKTIWDSIKNFLHNLTQKVHDYSTIATGIVNGFKTIEASQAFQFLEVVLETLIPASTGLVNAFKLEFPNILRVLELVTNESGKTDKEIVADGAAALQALKVSNPKLYALKLAGLNALTAGFFADNAGENATFAQLLALGQSTYAAVK